MEGWKSNQLGTGFTLKYNDELAQLECYVSSTNFPATFTNFGYIIPSDLKPNCSITSVNSINGNAYVMVASDGNIQRRSATGSALNNQKLECILTWHY